MTNLNKLQHIQADLNEAAIPPEEIEVARLGNYFFSNLKIGNPRGVISEKVVGGFDRDLETSIMKAFSEYVEAKSFHRGRKDNLESCLTERSDGFAAFPVQADNYKQRGRDNALAEAIERYVWATWWDNQSIQFVTEEASSCHSSMELLEELSKLIPLRKIVKVSPRVNSEFKLVIFIAFLKNGGVISGGACGKNEEKETRAMGELIRHGIAALKFKNGAEPTSFYEKRLSYFLSAQGEHEVSSRLKIEGNENIELPLLKFDCEVPSVAPNSVYVHRCLFHDQPVFIGGNVERFCL